MNTRIHFLDGLRGIAILLVIGFHAFDRWSLIVPYGDDYAWIPLFNAGWVGVQLFFLISGFVILLTLEKCRNASHFIYRRWLRLFPAMLICSLLIYFTAGFFSERPAGNPDLLGLLPGLTFTDPKWWSWLMGVNIIPLEGVFWSLYVEFKFYIFAALIYFWRGRTALMVALVASYGLFLFATYAVFAKGNYAVALLSEIVTALSFKFFGWFAAGAAFYVFYSSKNKIWFAAGMVLALVSAAFVKGLAIGAACAAAAMSIFFAISLVSHKLQRLLSNPLLLFFGMISYPFYLIHENAMVSLIVKVADMEWGVPGLLLPVIAVIPLCAVAFLITKYGEPAAKNIIVYIIKHVDLTKPKKIIVES